MADLNGAQRETLIEAIQAECGVRPAGSPLQFTVDDVTVTIHVDRGLLFSREGHEDVAVAGGRFSGRGFTDVMVEKILDGIEDLKAAPDPEPVAETPVEPELEVDEADLEPEPEPEPEGDLDALLADEPAAPVPAPPRPSALEGHRAFVDEKEYRSKRNPRG